MDMKTITKQAEDKIDVITAASIEVMELIAKAAWNEAIEAAAQAVEKSETAGQRYFHAQDIRKLKK